MSTKLQIKVIPNAKRNEIIGVMEDGTIKIRIKAPALEGRANAMLLQFLSDVLKIQKKELNIISGDNSVQKVISIASLEENLVRSILLIKQHK